MLLVRSCQ